LTFQGLPKPRAPKRHPNGRLRQAVRDADAAYRRGEAFLADAEFDALVAELQRVDPSAPELLTPGGGDKLLSLGNQDLADWLADIGTAAAGRFTVTPKVDGCAIALQYVEGHLTAAWTRSGADAMHLLPLVGNVPHTLAAPICAQIRGELYGLDGRQSTPAAALRRKVPSGAGLAFLAFEVMQSLASHATQLMALERWGLHTPPHLLCSAAELEGHHQAWLRGQLWADMPTDGLVAVVDDGQQRRRLGVTSLAPRYALAMKQWEVSDLRR
jgi:DNA ligase (NAD+)